MTALDALASKLKLRDKIPSWDSISGYTYTISNPEDIDEYLSHYETLVDDDEKFALMEIIVDALGSQPDRTLFTTYAAKVKELLVADYTIQAFTIYYWFEMANSDIVYATELTDLLNQGVDSQAD